jgi:hypothetical protein
MNASSTISRDENQSNVSPRSSIIWNDPIARLSAPKPIQSRVADPLRELSLRKVSRPIAVTIPNGTLM